MSDEQTVIIMKVATGLLLAFTLWLFWTVFGYGAKFFYWLPDVYQAPTFVEIFGLFLVGRTMCLLGRAVIGA